MNSSYTSGRILERNFIGKRPVGVEIDRGEFSDMGNWK
jgi:hypothetical protein